MSEECNEHLGNLISILDQKDRNKDRRINPEELFSTGNRDIESYKRSVHLLRNCYFASDKEDFLNSVHEVIKEDQTCKKLGVTLKDIMEWLNIPYESFSEKIRRAKKELRENGITSEQQQAHGVFSNIIYERINPLGYPPKGKNTPKGYDIYDVPKHLREFILSTSKSKNERATTKMELLGRDDAWRLYLGLPQQHQTFDISDYQPVKGKDINKYYYKLQPEVEEMIFGLAFYGDERSEIREKISLLEAQIAEKRDRISKIEGLIREKSNEKSSIDITLSFERRDLRTMEEDLQELKTVVSNNYAFVVVDAFNKGSKGSLLAKIMGNFTISYGEDRKGHYISYYDLWDLDPSLFGIKIDASLIAGKAFEIYNRIYYDPKTGKRLE